jgi:hypothetical protein
VSQIEPLPPAKLSPRFQVPVILCEQVRQVYSEQHFLVFLDNLFPNVEVAHCLLAIGFAIMGNTQKYAAGLPKSLDYVKKADKASKSSEKKQLLVYNSVLAVIVQFCLCFLWQDNNAVLAISRAHNLHRQEIRAQRNRHALN